MSQEIRAIFDNGVFRPLEPLDLPNGTCVNLHIGDDERGSDSILTPSHTELRNQQLALNTMFQDVDRLPQKPSRDGLSGRDHDEILYGARK